MVASDGLITGLVTGVVDGAVAAACIQRVKQLLEAPATLFID